MNEKQLKRVLDQLAGGLTDVDLWPAVRARLETSKRYSHQGDLTMNTKLTSGRRLRLASAIFLPLLVVAALLFATPQGRALAQEFMQFFSRAKSDTLPAPTDEPLVWVNQAPGALQPTSTALPQPGPAFSSDCGPYSNPQCSIAQMRSKVNFTVKEFGAIPDGLYFIGATGGADQVYILYDTGGHRGFVILWESPWTGSPEQTQWQVGASAVVEKVQIGSLNGEYVKGSFTYFAGQPVEKWDANQDTQTMRWVDNGVFINMQSAGSAMPLDRDKFVALAESLTTEMVSARLTPTPDMAVTPTNTVNQDLQPYWNLTLAEAREKAPFSLLLPTRLPDFLNIYGAGYDADIQVVRVFYLLDQSRYGYNTDGLVVSEQLIPANGECYLCKISVGQYTGAETGQTGKLVGANATVTPVQIGDIRGEYVEGVWSGTDCCGWVWENDPYAKSLRWQAHGMAFELGYNGMSITMDNMITIAESMK
jgi:hypothetical protein